MPKALKRAVDPAMIRILLRYGAGALAGYSVLPPAITDLLRDDPELAGAIAAIIVVSVEGFYTIARKLGWRT
jgi:hypothetical protein